MFGQPGRDQLDPRRSHGVGGTVQRRLSPDAHHGRDHVRLAVLEGDLALRFGGGHLHGGPHAHQLSVGALDGALRLIHRDLGPEALDRHLRRDSGLDGIGGRVHAGLHVPHRLAHHVQDGPPLHDGVGRARGVPGRRRPVFLPAAADAEDDAQGDQKVAHRAILTGCQRCRRG
jgi:hypothetical protein